MSNCNPALMTVGELVDRLSEFDQDLRVNIAEQPKWAMEFQVKDVVASVNNQGELVIYIVEGYNVGYLPEPVAEAIGWKD